MDVSKDKETWMAGRSRKCKVTTISVLFVPPSFNVGPTYVRISGFNIKISVDTSSSLKASDS